MRFGGRAYKIEDVKRIGSLGLDFAEINFSAGGDLIYESEDWLREAEKWDLTYLMHAPKEGDPWDLKRLRGSFFEEILRLLEACQELSSPLLTVHFWMDRRFIPEKVFKQKQEILDTMAQGASQAGVHLCLETLSERPEDLYPLLTGCSQLDLTLDIGHMELLSDDNRSVKLLKLFPERIRHVHAHDNRGGNRVEDDLHLPIGEGVIDFPSIFQALIKAGYTKTVTVEVPHDHLEASVLKLHQIADSLKE